MKNLLRAAAVCALAFTALSTVEAATSGICQIRCYSSGSVAAVTVSTSQSECCGADVDRYCPPGYSGVAIGWGGRRC